MSFATAMWIALAVIAVVLLLTIALEDRRVQREFREARRQWQDDMDRRTR